MYNSGKRTITTKRLLLRPFEIEDAENVYRLCNDNKIHKGTLNLPYPYTMECALNWIPTHKENFDNDKAYEFAITDRKTGVLYGCISLSNHQEYKNGECGYWIGSEFWGNGYASEALTALIEFAFVYKDFHKVYARHFEFNPASGRVMQKSGMVYEGKQIDQVVKDGKFATLILYGIINPANS